MNRREFLKMFFLAGASAAVSALTSCSSEEETKAKLEKVGGKTYTYLGFKEIDRVEIRRKSINKYMLRLDADNDGKADALWVVDPLTMKTNPFVADQYHLTDINAILELEVGRRVTVEDLMRLTPQSDCQLQILRPMQAPLVYKVKKGALKANF